MEFFKRLFKINKTPVLQWKLFSTSKSKGNKVLDTFGVVTIADDFLKIENYPFEPSIAYRQTIFKAKQIDDIDYKSYPSTMKVGNELIYIAFEKKAALENFATINKIKTTQRPMIWGWILEPFLDTEFTVEEAQRSVNFLASFGLTAKQVQLLRAEVEVQMMKYNFDSMLWEWAGFDFSDVLRSMRPKYNKEQFNDFYKRVMKIALLTKIE